MRISLEALKNWRERIRSYGLVNSLRLLYFLRRDGEFSIRINGKRFFLRGRSVDFSVLNSIIGKGEYDIEPGFVPGIIVDAGANTGASTLYFRMRFPEARIIAVEPEASNFSLLSRNMEAWPGVQCINAALWFRDGWLSLRNPSADHYAYQFDEIEGSDTTVRSLSLSTLMADAGAETIDILKMDIEGAEYQIFSHSNTDWLRKVKMVIVELHEYINPGVEELFMKAAESVPHRIFLKGENTVLINTGLIRD
ncbi:FkbM family methyltransferase [bacterium]|nr:FkbM family methyltransferase [bacterium]